jgi:CRP-like cAMP-binding protein
VHQLQLLADSAMGIDFRPEESIFREDEPANCFYLILEGKVALEFDVKDCGVIAVPTLEPGDSVG